MADNSSLQSLLSTKAALDLGLISQSDFDTVKNSFLRAQQIKTAVDTGVIRAEDYEEAKQTFLSMLTGGAPPASDGAVAATPRPPPVAWQLPPPSPPAAKPRREGSAAAGLAGQAATAQQTAAPPRTAANGTAAPSAGVAGTSLRKSASNPDVPSNIPKMGGVKSKAQGTSMSGIAVTEDAVNLFYLMRLKATYKWALWQVDDNGVAVVIAAVGDKESSWDDFLAALPDADCRYGVFDFDFQSPDGQTLHKMVFLNWAPDAARVKSKMMYASTKDFFKSHLDGLSLEFQASDKDEINEQEVGDAVRALKRG